MNTYDVWAGWDFESMKANVNRTNVFGVVSVNAECVVTWLNTKSIGKARAKKYTLDFTPTNQVEAFQLLGFFEKKGRTLVSVVYNGQELLTSVEIPPPAPIRYRGHTITEGAAGFSCEHVVDEPLARVKAYIDGWIADEANERHCESMAAARFEDAAYGRDD